MKRTELKRKSAKPKKPRTGPRCSWSNRCTKRPTVTVTEDERLCKTHAKWVLDKLVGDYVKWRDMSCQHCGDGSDETAQWAHIRSRAATTIRWEVDSGPGRIGNSVRLCSKCHYHFTLAPNEWDRFVERWWPGQWIWLVNEESRLLGIGDSVDLAGLIRLWKARWAENSYRRPA